jgi:hypothetical protein
MEQNGDDIAAADAVCTQKSSGPIDVSTQRGERYLRCPTVDVAIRDVKDRRVARIMCGQTQRDALRDIDDAQALVERDPLDRFDVGQASQWLVEQSSIRRLRHDGCRASSLNIAWFDRLRHVPPIVFAW